MRFSIRDLFWITVVVALALGWWLDHRRLTPKPYKTPPHYLLNSQAPAPIPPKD